MKPELQTFDPQAYLRELTAEDAERNGLDPELAQRNYPAAYLKMLQEGRDRISDV